MGLTNETGPNGTSVSLGYDANARPSFTTSPFGAATVNSYHDTASPPNTCTTVNNRWTQSNLDGLGRPILILVGYGSSCGSGTFLSQSENTYGSCGCSPAGKLISTTVPHAYGSSASATTTYTYDGLGRTLSKAVVGSDTQGTTTYSYQGNTVTVTDPAGKWKTYTMDGFGNLITVNEPNPAGGSNYVTNYTYDVLNHLTGVSMPRSTGTQTRSFVYSGNLLMTATNPENGTVTYTYNSPGQVATRTDAKGQATKYSYDSYARLTEVQHYPSGLGNAEDICQQEDYSYDGNNPLSSSYPQNAAGHLSAVRYWSPYDSATNACDTTFTEMYTYGVPGAPVGKQLTVARTLPAYVDNNMTAPVALNLNATYTYDNEGRTTNETYPTDNYGYTANLSYTFDSMGRLNTMTDNIANQEIISGTTYGPANEVTALSEIFGGGETRTYNSLKQLTNITSGGVNRTYNYPSTNNNGKIGSETDNLSGEVVTYTYDSLNRLATAENQSGFSPSWGQSFTYDGFGNLTQTNTIQGSAPTMAATYDVNNHAGSQDANGNPYFVPLPASGTSALGTYDIENRLTAVNGVMNYAYAPGNKRVWRGGNGSTDEITFWSVSGRKLGTYQISFVQGCYSCPVAPQFYYTQTGTNYYFGGKLVKDKGGFVYLDRQGSLGKYYPYGVERPSATTNGIEKFTGYFRDSESGNDYADQRYYVPGNGRFLTPDRKSGHPADPGSLNKYAYVGGDPVTRIDRHGRDYEVCDDSGSCQTIFTSELAEFDVDAIAEEEENDSSSCFGEGNVLTTSCEEELLMMYGFAQGFAQDAPPTSSAPPLPANKAQSFAIALGAWQAATSYVNGNQQGLLSNKCGKLMTALGGSAAGLTEASWLGALNAEVLSNAALASSVTMASLFNGTQYKAAANVTYRSQTVAAYAAATSATTVAVSQLNGNNVYLNVTQVSIGNPDLTGAIALHEALHNLLGLDDLDLEVDLKAFGGQKGNASSITSAILDNCF